MNSDNKDFSTLNARKLSPIEVSKTFIPPSYFTELLESNNFVLVGPRGSGKTTLLKMLDLLALANWKHGIDEEIIKNINYISVFVPIDIDWERQWSNSINKLSCTNEIKSLLRIALFTNHVHTCILNTFIDCNNKLLLESEYLKKFHITLDKTIESKLTKEIATNFDLNLQIPSLSGLKLSFTKRLKDLGNYINYYSIHNKEPNGNHTFIYDDFFDSIKLMIGIINEYLDNKKQKWAFSFDELEIAPMEIRKKLFSLLRKGDDRFLFKLSMVPYVEDFETLTNTFSSSNNNDFKTIHLWYKHKDDSTKFCQELFKQMCKAMNLGNIDLKSIFGWSEFELGRLSKIKGESAYINSKAMKERFISLAEKDLSFGLHLKKGKIEPSDWENLNDIERASKIRKITNIVSVRNAFRSGNGLRTRKSTNLYSGGSSLFDLTEGNPRVFITLVGSLLKIYKNNNNGTVSHTIQNSKIDENMSRFRALLSTIPVIKEDHSKYNNFSVLELLEKIGNFFFKEVVLDDFKVEPALSFIVDKKTPIEIRKLIGNALNYGAIVYMPDESNKTVINSLEEKRFRLNRLLSPYFKIPMITGQSRNLSGILNDAREQKGTTHVSYRQTSINLD